MSSNCIDGGENHNKISSSLKLNNLKAVVPGPRKMLSKVERVTKSIWRIVPSRLAAARFLGLWNGTPIVVSRGVWDGRLEGR